MENNVRSVEFCDERVMTGDEDGYITFWDMKTLKQNTGEDNVASYRAHNTYVEVQVMIVYKPHKPRHLQYCKKLGMESDHGHYYIALGIT